MTNKIQPLDVSYIAVLKNIYKKWINNQIVETNKIPPKFEKIEKISQIIYSLRPEIGLYCCNKTIFMGNEELEQPEEIADSQVEIQVECTKNKRWV